MGKLHKIHLSGEIKPSGRLIAHKPPKEKEALKINVADEVGVSDAAVAHGEGELVEGVRVADSQRQSVAADLRAAGDVISKVEGPSPKGSDDSSEVEACQTLIERLNRDGAQWGPPVKVDRQDTDVDCVSRDGERSLQMQVTRAWQDPEMRDKLAREGSVEVMSSVDEAVDKLRNAIGAKENLAGLQRRQLVLVLDARETPAQSFKRVVNSFRSRHGRNVCGLGFQGIWVVGPTADLTARLDQST